MIPQFLVKSNDKVLVDYSDLDIRVESKQLKINLDEKDLTPQSYGNELLALGGCKLNVTSTIDKDATSEDVIRGWFSLNELVRLDSLFIPFLYYNFIEYPAFGIMSLEPKWTKLLRLCYWYQKCLDIPSSNFHYKQNEFKRRIKKPLRRVEESLKKFGLDFITKVEELSEIIMSYSSELLFAACSHNLGYRVIFNKKHDFLLNNIPVEVKTLYSHINIDKQKEIPRIVIGGEPRGEFNLKSEILSFIKSKKVLNHIRTAKAQGGSIIFLNASQTFAGLLLNLFPIQENIDLPLSNALKDAVNLASKKEKNPLPVIIYSSINSHVHTTSALMVSINVAKDSG
ncbi:MAG: hypothetical protein Q6352_015255 [Candidatus Freyrarchaeum guaymaensis]